MVFFILTLIFTLLMTAGLPLLWGDIISAYMPMAVYALLLLIPCFFIMCGYGYVIRKARRFRVPAGRIGLYAPLFVPLIWYLINVGICNALDSTGDIAALLIGFWTFHLFGFSVCDHMTDIQLSGLGLWHSTLLWNLLYDFVLISGFAVGERLSAKRTGAKPTHAASYKKILVSVFFALILCAYAFSEFMLFRHRENIVDTARPSYNFSYAGGYSSIDLRPYSVENEENILAKLAEPSSFCINKPEEMPIMDGAEAAYPVYSAFANACYSNIGEIQKKAGAPKSDTVMPIQFSNTIYAYEKLIAGEIDIFFGAKPSEAQLKMATDAGVALKLTPIGKEAFVFFVNEKNPVNNLSSEQLRDIYSGRISSWRDVGGKNQRILAFQRPENSGSQTMMEYFMGGTPLREPLESEYETAMGGVVRQTADYDNGASSLGYSFRYYTTVMMAQTDEGAAGIKLLSVDGLYPDAQTIQSGEYPYTTQLYAITVANRADTKGTIEPFLEWMTGPQGQQIVSDTGYVAIH